jgi:hypothetical protein
MSRSESVFADGVTFLNQVELQDGIQNPLAAMPAVKEFAEKPPNGWQSRPLVKS